MLLELEGVERTYDATTGAVVALHGIDLQVGAGEFVVLTGPSGAGKTTLLHVAGLLDAPTRGSVRFDKRDISAMPGREVAALRLARIGFVFQHHYLVPDLTVVENVALPALAAHAPDPFARADALLARVDLVAARDRLPRELSGGEQQRAGVARALVNAPALLLCDEPTGNLDPASADVVAALLASANAQGAAVLVATHEPSRFPHAGRRVRIVAGALDPEGHEDTKGSRRGTKTFGDPL